KEKDYTKVLDLSKAWLEKCPVDAEVHFMRGQALIAQGDIAHYSMELYYFYGLVTSITSSGDGTSEKTAFKLISPEEENFVLSDFGAEPTGQTMEGTCDIVRCKVNDGKGGEKEVTYYFDISISIAAEAKQFEHNKTGGGSPAPARGGGN
ncbi:MAG TPA: DUF4919 domain-containing protein, partial [Chthoniobacteraceae bacterium]|nr:DUF4919 domain-containing protein [Chthoniobacteraceae bacterium]